MAPDSFETATAPIASVEQATEQSGITDVVARVPAGEDGLTLVSSKSAISAYGFVQQDNDHSPRTNFFVRLSDIEDCPASGALISATAADVSSQPENDQSFSADYVVGLARGRGRFDSWLVEDD
jgi:hypothetical protein